MRGRGLLAAFLLAIGVCLVPVSGYGDSEKWKKLHEENVPKLDWIFLDARVRYIMENPTSFLAFYCCYDTDGFFGRAWSYWYRKNFDTTGKIVVEIHDNRDIFSGKSGTDLLDEFRRQLEKIAPYIGVVTSDMDKDIVAELFSKEANPLCYFYEGEYHLREKYGWEK